MSVIMPQVCVWVTAVVDRLVVRNSALSDVRCVTVAPDLLETL